MFEQIVMILKQLNYFGKSQMMMPLQKIKISYPFLYHGDLSSLVLRLENC